MKTLYLHIGTHKTATTTIQRFLAANQETLSAQGCAFPLFSFFYRKRSPDRNGLFLTWPAEGENGERDPAEEERRFVYAMDVIHKCFETHDIVVLTDEALWRNLYSRRNRHNLQRLLEDAEEHGYTVKMIIYLRRQDQFIESMWNQSVKKGTDLTMDLDEYIHAYRHKYLNYDKILFYYGDTIGDENLIIRRFADSVKGDGILADFLGLLGLELTDEYAAPSADSNLGLYGNTIRFKQLINGLDEMTNEENWIFRNGLDMVAATAKEEYPCSEFSEETRGEFMKQFEDGNAAIVDRFLKDGKPLFSMDYSGNPKRFTDNPWVMEDSFRVSAATDLVLYRALCDLREEHLILKSQHFQLLRMHKEATDRIKFLERQAVKHERRIEHLRHPLRRFIGRILSIFGIHRQDEPVERWTRPDGDDPYAPRSIPKEHIVLPGLDIEPYPENPTINNPDRQQ